MKTIWLNSVAEITPELLKQFGIKALVLDVDNTLTTHGNPVPADGVTDWLESMKGIKLLILSNNSHERVKPFADLLGLGFIPDAAKPLPNGINRALKVMGTSKSETAIVGDQIFTDILAAKLTGIKSIHCRPIELETTLFFRIKRLAEKPFVNRGSKQVKL